MNVLSLFDGMSCGQIALDKLGIKVDNYFASEIESHAIKSTSYVYPSTKHIGDVRDVKGENLPKIDLLIGGSPCQSFSFAGKGNGMTTKDSVEILSLEHYLELKSQDFIFKGQSYLFWEYVRLLKETKPKYFLLENVRMSKKWANVITEVLGVDYIEINSNKVSAQNRIRYYWTNIPNVTQPLSSGCSLRNVIDFSIGKVEYVVPKTTVVKHCEKYIQYDLSGKGNSSQQWRIRNLDYPSNCLTVSTSSTPKICVSEDLDSYYVRKLTADECRYLQNIPDDVYFRVKQSGVTNPQILKMLGNGWTVDVIAHIFKNLK